MSTVYSPDEVSKHDDDHSLWIVIHNKVYDVSGCPREPLRPKRDSLAP